MKRITNPGNYDIVFCSLCTRDAELPETLDGFHACIKCGGFGFVMREKRSSKKNRRYTRRETTLYDIRTKKVAHGG